MQNLEYKNTLIYRFLQVFFLRFYKVNLYQLKTQPGRRLQSTILCDSVLFCIGSNSPM